MTTDVITPAEAMKEIMNRRIDIYHNALSARCCASVEKPKYLWAFGADAVGAVGNLLARIAEAATKAEATNA